MTATPKIKLTDVHKKFGSKVVLDGVNLQVMPGESLVIIGGSGSGKSVTIKTVLGLIRPDSGTIEVDGENITRYSFSQRAPMLQKIGMLFQGGALFDSLPVWKNITFGAAERGQKLTTATARTLAVEKLEAVGLKAEVADLMPAELSGGMQKRVGLARAIAANPDLLFFDEPTTGLDPIMADVINNLIVSSVKKLGSTAVTITHDMASVRKIASRVAMIYQGKIIWDGPISDIDNSGNPYVDQFIHGKAEGPITNEFRRA
ncbi:MAG: ATP-binding cassette domain-containing protein [Alphaproteobacteria bacterium]|nr:ATP-binding cassette domain-containing protein [Alphaproteobacteria bacterium]